MSRPVWKTLQSLGDRGNIYVDEDGDAHVELWDEYGPDEEAEYEDDECSNSVGENDEGWCEATRAQHTVEAGGTGEEVSAEACGAFEPETNRTRFQVYRFGLDRFSMHKELFDEDWKIIPYGFHLRTDLPYPVESYEQWFSKDLDGIADSVSTTRQELAEALCSADPLDRFWAYDAIGGVHGFENFDDYPLDLSERELKAREDE